MEAIAPHQMWGQRLLVLAAACKVWWRWQHGQTLVVMGAWPLPDLLPTYQVDSGLKQSVVARASA